MAWKEGKRRKGYPRLAAASEAGRKRISADALLVASIVLSALILLATFLLVRTSSLAAPVRNNITHEVGSRAAFGAVDQTCRRGRACPKG